MTGVVRWWRYSGTTDSNGTTTPNARRLGSVVNPSAACGPRTCDDQAEAAKSSATRSELGLSSERQADAQP